MIAILKQCSSMKADGTFLCYWIITEKMLIAFFFPKMSRSGRAMKNETQTQIFSADGLILPIYYSWIIARKCRQQYKK